MEKKLTRAEEKALEAYPVKMVDGPIGYEGSVFDFNAFCRYIFQEGYEQAEKDLADVAQFSSGPDGFFYGKGYQQAKKDIKEAIVKHFKYKQDHSPEHTLHWWVYKNVIDKVNEL